MTSEASSHNISYFVKFLKNLNIKFHITQKPKKNI